MKKFFLLMAGVAISLQLSAQNFSAAPTDGYRGFASLNMFSGMGDYPYDRFAISTVHGFQSERLFMGLGTSLQFVTNNDNYYDGYYDDEGIFHYEESDDPDFQFAMPFFFNLNYEMPMGKFAPFADLKLGYAVGDVSGIYVLPSVGLRLSHFSVWCGYNWLEDKEVRNKKTKTTDYHSIAVGVTIDWGGRKNM